MEYDLYHAQIPVHNDSIQQIKDFNTMGPIASFIQGLDKAAEKEEAAKKALEIGIKMVQNRFENFEANLNLPVGAVKKVPAQYLIASKKIISCNVSQGTKQNKEAIQGIVQDFANGETAKGIVNTLFTGLDMILGSFNASYDESQDYMVLTNLIGGVYRIDYLVLQQKIQGKGFSDKITSVFGSYLIITAINKKELLTDNVYKILVDRQFASFTVFIKFILVKLLKEEELTPEEVSAIGNLTYADLEFNQDGFLLNAEGKLVYQNQKPGSDVDISKIKTILKQDVDEMTSKELDQEIELNNKVIRSLKRAVVKAEKNQKEIEDQLKKAQDKISNLTEQLRAQQDIAKILENQIAIKKKDQEVDNLTKNINQLHLKEEDLKTVMSVLKRVQKKKRQELHN